MSDVDDPRIAFYGQDGPTMETRIAALESQLATITAERDAMLSLAQQRTPRSRSRRSRKTCSQRQGK